MSREHIIKRGVYILNLIGYNKIALDEEDFNNPFYITPNCMENVLKHETFISQHGTVDRSRDLWTFEFSDDMKALLKLAFL